MKGIWDALCSLGIKRRYIRALYNAYNETPTKGIVMPKKSSIATTAVIAGVVIVYATIYVKQIREQQRIREELARNLAQELTGIAVARNTVMAKLNAGDYDHTDFAQIKADFEFYRLAHRFE